ncbi:hypothetical protein B0I35DRAFT_483060 [Stachybotrys elegans]|uniref:Uncharacterized protein n=1 Tax=Stachybotrys elegans TaxID=80388 RepID=A0A8K0SGA0_9HYPO|nr:hypothetical protein B0I35DRAFT_483060 [Stachybotrys elegans]
MRPSLLSKRAPVVKPQCGAITYRGHASTVAQNNRKPEDETQPKDQPEHASAKKKKTVTELDSELRARLEEMSGDGGAAGVEYENGVAEGLRSEVKRNMFRVI